MTVSPSASDFVVAAVSVSLVCGLADESATVAAGAVFATVAVSVAAAPLTVPSFGVTVTETASPWSPWPAVERSKIGPVAPATTVPFTFQT